MELAFLNMGMYGHATVDQLDYMGLGLARLRKDGIYFESPTNEWVYEEDVTPPSGLGAPISVSGVWINSVFHTNGSAPYRPYPDYKNGRFIFKGTVPTNADVVQANYSYKDVSVVYRDSETYNALMSQYLHNPDYWSAQIFPSGIERLLPVVVVDLQTRQHRGRQIGGGAIQGDRVHFWVYAARDWERDFIMDAIFDQKRNAIIGTDYNDVPEALTYDEGKAATYQSFTDLGANFPWTNIYIDKMSHMERDLIFKVFRGRVEGLFTIYEN
jgi:hypothetical protein